MTITQQINNNTMKYTKEELEKNMSKKDAESYLRWQENQPQKCGNIKELIAAHPKPPVLIDGLLHQGSKLVLGGESKSYKTWTLIQMGLCVSEGIPFLGRETTPGKVLFVNYEVQAPFFYDRLGAIMERLRASEPKLLESLLEEGHESFGSNFSHFCLRGRSHEIVNSAHEIEMACDDEIADTGTGFSLIIIDPFYKLMDGGADENSASDIAGIMSTIESTARKTNAAVAFGAHFAKGNAGGKAVIDRIAGSGVFARDPDAMLTITRHAALDDGFVVDTVLRNFPPQDPFVIRRDHPLMIVADDEEPIAEGAWNSKAAAKYTAQTIVDLLPPIGQEVLAPGFREEVMDQTGMSASTFQKKKRDAVDAGLMGTRDSDDKDGNKMVYFRVGQ